ncbi:MAG: GTP cyclohydrolase I FolE2 [Phycisphaeraceae bacterium]|nr:GTP cyclohydrolase I FolE2 [Phycisphaeraceae bacterium]
MKPPLEAAEQLLPDIQASPDDRHLAIDRVGVSNLRYPLTVSTRDGRGQTTVGEFNLSVSLPHDQKGTHMSRFLEVLNEQPSPMVPRDVLKLAQDVQRRLQAPHAFVRVDFPFFIDKPAPVSGVVGKIDVRAGLSAEVGPTGRNDWMMSVKVPATSLCPCSRQISEYGAHNQRCEMEAHVRIVEGASMSFEELIDRVEQAASTQVFSVLKRPDEKWVTEKAYENPKFVEDIVRDLALAMEREPRIAWYRVRSENYESIHNHDAFAQIERDLGR